MPVWQSSRTLLVVTEGLRELAEVHGSWAFPGKLFCWEERQQCNFKEVNQIDNISARIRN